LLDYLVIGAYCIFGMTSKSWLCWCP